MRPRYPFYIVLILTGLVGCIAPKQPVSNLRIPETWSELPKDVSAAQSTALARWWRTFEDPTLETLIDQGVQANLDLREATARILEARDEKIIVAAEGWPMIGASASYIRSRRSSTTFSNSSDTGDETTGDVSGTSFGFGEEQDFYQTSLDSAWELDVFGRVRWSVKAADAQIGAAEENRRDVLVALLADIARSYVELRGFQRRLAIARNNIQTQKDSVEVTWARYQAGLTSAEDLAQAETLLASTSAQVPTFQIGVKQTIHRLGVLLGQPPEALLAELSPEAPIPEARLDPEIGLPSELLRRRPDIRRAERELEAATARIGVATADLFPRFSLTGALGAQGIDLSDLGTASGLFWAVGPRVRWPLFEAGRIRANIRAQNALQEQALARYEKTILTALEEAENALVAYAKERGRYQWLAQAVVASQEAVDIAQERYVSGLVNFLNVVVAQRALYQSEDELAQSQIAITSNLIALYRALGGGWETSF